MVETTKDDEQTYYVCGQCRDKQWYRKTASPPVPCPDCGWPHKDLKKSAVPSEVKLDISKY